MTQMLHFYEFFLNSEGSMPKASWKQRVKYERLLNPDAKATSRYRAITSFQQFRGPF